jgi:uncharacterized protein YxjI
MELVRQVGGVDLTTQSSYTIKRPFWSFMERTFRVFTTDGQLIMFVRHPVLKLREEFIVYADEARTQPLLRIKAQQMIALNFKYDITDAATGQLLGTVQKQGLKSLIRDKFLILDPTGAEIGYAEEQGHSILRRFFPYFLMARHAIFARGQKVAEVRQIFRFFMREFAVDMQPMEMDPRFVLAVALLALMADSRREDQR